MSRPHHIPRLRASVSALFLALLAQSVSYAQSSSWDTNTLGSSHLPQPPAITTHFPSPSSSYAGSQTTAVSSYLPQCSPNPFVHDPLVNFQCYNNVPPSCHAPCLTQQELIQCAALCSASQPNTPSGFNTTIGSNTTIGLGNSPVNSTWVSQNTSSPNQNFNTTIGSSPSISSHIR